MDHLLTRREQIKARVAKDIETIRVGIGATKYVGSDAYPYYVAEAKITPNGWYVVGMYEADSHFKGSWEAGTQTVDPFDPSKSSEFWLRLYRNAWYISDKDGTLLKPHRKEHYIFGYACAFQDPSF